MSDWKPPRHGPPGSLLRALQRGTGGGYLRALKAPTEQVQAMLLSFAESDPCWDHQLERREEYWGDLAVDVGLPAEPLAEIALSLDVLDDEGDHDGNHYPALAILGQMAARGRVDALHSLLVHVERGWSWDDAVRELEESGPAAMERTSEALVRRFGAGPELKAALAGVDDRWEQFEEIQGPAGDAARAMRAEHDGAEATLNELKPDFAAMSLEELRLYADDWVTASQVAAELRRRKTPFSDVSTWLRTRPQSRRTEANFDGVIRKIRVLGYNHVAATVFQAMQGTRDPAAIAASVDWLESPMRWGDGRMALRRFAVGVLQAAPPSLALPIARRWWSNPRLRTYALDLFEVHAEPEDIERIIPLLGQRFTLGTHYLIDGALDALAKHPGHGPFPGLESLYHRAAMSCTRTKAVKLMAATEPEFASGLACECLWDAEPEIRREAARVVDLARPGVRERLEFLASDTTAPDEVRTIAQQRLART